MKEYIIKVDENKKDVTGGMPLMDRPHELVRCKDCAYYIDDGCGNIDGDSPARNLIDVKPDWFCADGERRT